MARKADRLKAALTKARTTADQAQASYIKAEDRYTELAAREHDRAARAAATRGRR